MLVMSRSGRTKKPRNGAKRYYLAGYLTPYRDAAPQSRMRVGLQCAGTTGAVIEVNAFEFFGLFLPSLQSFVHIIVMLKCTAIF
jgi:hypothetical protein